MVDKATENFTPMNTRQENIWCRVLQLHNIPTPPTPKVGVLGYEPGRWCKFHKVKGHHIQNFYHLKKEIERPIHDGHLKKYVKYDSSHSSNKSNPRG